MITAMQNRKIHSVLIVLLIIAVGSICSAQTFDTTLARKLQRTLDSVRISQNYKGISASVIIQGRGTWLGASGISHPNVNVTPSMYLGIGSNTKTLMSVLTLKLAELNVLNIDDSLHKWISVYQYVDSSITIRQLLNHTSGIFDFTTITGYADSILSNPNRIWTPDELLHFLNPPYFPKGQGFQYSNTNYLILGMIIETAISSQVSAKLRELILNPLNLTKTYFPINETVPDTIVHPWVNGIDINSTPRISLLSSAWTAGALYSTSENMGRWYQQLFGGQVLSQSSMSQMLTFTPQSSGVYGLGVIKYLISGRVLWGHSGSIRGYTSHMLYDTAMKMSITVLQNQLPGNPVVVSTALLNTVINNPLGINPESSKIPDGYNLYQNYPNPFNPSTKIRFDIPTNNQSVNVRLVIYDCLGRKKQTLVNQNLKAGTYQVDFNGAEYAGGVYFYSLTANHFSETKKMVIIK
jgi:D-alanyl-D-alanine carboxypeptidase